MKTRVWNGEDWYMDERSLLVRARQWIVRPMGWEIQPKKTQKAEWRVFRRSALDKRIHINDITPLCFLGGRLTFQWFGVTWRGRSGYVCWSWRRSMGEKPGKGYAYISRNATPGAAHLWLWGWDKYHGLDNSEPPG